MHFFHGAVWCDFFSPGDYQCFSSASDVVEESSWDVKHHPGFDTFVRLNLPRNGDLGSIRFGGHRNCSGN